MNSATLYQARLHSLYKEYLWENLIKWIDDLLGQSKTLEEWFTVLENVLLIAEKVGLVSRITKCALLLKDVKGCGKSFSENGVKHDPERIRSLLELPSPCDAQQLQQFIYATQWMARTIPQYVSKMLILTDLSESIMAKQSPRELGRVHAESAYSRCGGAT